MLPAIRTAGVRHGPEGAAGNARRAGLPAAPPCVETLPAPRVTE